MNNAKSKKWEVIGKSKKSKNSKKNKLNVDEIVDILLANRGITTLDGKREFLNPKDPAKIGLKEIGISVKSVKIAIKRLKQAKVAEEKIIIYGDYDADGICATAILWEALYKLGFDVMPYLPDRFEEGYGLNAKSVKNLKSQFSNLKLIITVDNGVVAHDAVEAANELGVDVIITDHHQQEEKYPKAFSVIHTTEIGGAGVAWFLAREIYKNFQLPISGSLSLSSDISGHASQFPGLELAAIGTVSDQIPLLGPNRSIVKYGIEELNLTSRKGLLALFKEAVLTKGELDTYSIGFGIAPRINAMGRLAHAMDSLRLLCTTDDIKASRLASMLGKTNTKRQEIVDTVVKSAINDAKSRKWKGAIVIAGVDYHEGVVGLAASKLVEEFYRPAIVLSKGVDVAKGSARSVVGFNIIDAIKKMDHLTIASGGHPMAAGLSIETKNLERFIEEFEKLTDPLLPDEMLVPTLAVDLELEFDDLSWDLLTELTKFVPTGSGNPAPNFVTRQVTVLDIKVVGKDAKHLKLKLQQKDKIFDAIAFGKAEAHKDLLQAEAIDIVYYFEENIWNGVSSMQLKVRDIKNWA